MCSLIVYLNCASIEPHFRLEIKMIWNWLLSLFTNETDLISISFELLKSISEDVNQNHDTLVGNQDLISSNNSSSNSIDHSEHTMNSTLNHHHCLKSLSKFKNLSLNAQCINNLPSKYNYLNKNSNRSQNQLNMKCKKLNKLNSTSLPDLVPDEERKRLALKEIGIKLRHISESFEKSLKR